MKKIKQLLAAVLAATMLLTGVPAGVLALEARHTADAIKAYSSAAMTCSTVKELRLLTAELVRSSCNETAPPKSTAATTAWGN